MAQLTSMFNSINYEHRPRARTDVDHVMQLTKTLTPKVGTLMTNNGTALTLVILYGTIPIYYKAIQYNIPLEIFLPLRYPLEAPKIFIRPTATMMVHQNHEHVDRDGHVFVPYLSQWQPQSSLKDLLKVLVSVFSAEPPLFTKSAAQPMATTPTPSYATPINQNTNTNMNQNTNNTAYQSGNYGNPSTGNNGNMGNNGNRSVTPNGGYNGTNGSNGNYGNNGSYGSDGRGGGPVYNSLGQTVSMGVNGSMAGGGGGGGGQMSQHERDRAASASPAASSRNTSVNSDLNNYTNTQEKSKRDRIALETSVTEKLQDFLKINYSDLRDNLESEFKIQNELHLSKNEIQSQISRLCTLKNNLELGMQEVEKKNRDLDEWLVEKEKEETVDCEDFLLPYDDLSAQLISLQAEQFGLEETIYALEEHLRSSPDSDIQLFLKTIRKLARQLFLVKLHIRKILGVVKDFPKNYFK